MEKILHSVPSIIVQRAPSTAAGTVTSVSGTTNRITVATGTTTPVIDISATFEALLGKVANPLSQFAATSSAQLLGVISDETGTGSLVFATSPTFVTPVLDIPTSGNLVNCTADGTNIVGFRIVPSNSQSAAYTAVLADSGKSIDHPSTDANARIFTIPSNAAVAFPIGACLSFSNMTTQVVSIAITTDTMNLAGTGTTGTRSLAQYGTATARKVAATVWLISGVGLT